MGIIAPVNNNNVHMTTFMFFRCLDYKYAKAFIEKGSMKFAHPSEWCKEDNTIRGDILEGVYASQRGYDSSVDAYFKSLRKDVFRFKKGDYFFYKSNALSYHIVHIAYMA